MNSVHFPGSQHQGFQLGNGPCIFRVLGCVVTLPLRMLSDILHMTLHMCSVLCISSERSRITRFLITSSYFLYQHQLHRKTHPISLCLSLRWVLVRFHEIKICKLNLSQAFYLSVCRKKIWINFNVNSLKTLEVAFVFSDEKLDFMTNSPFI